MDSIEKNSLKTLTLATVKTLSGLDKLLNTEANPQRDKKMRRLLKELEITNDEAMRLGLELSAQTIARMKTGRVKTFQPNRDHQHGANHSALMKFHHDHIKGPIGDAPAQGAAIKWLLASYAPEVLKKCYEFQLSEAWRGGRVSWLTVKSAIGSWLNNPRASTSKTDGSISAAQKVAAEFRNGNH